MGRKIGLLAVVAAIAAAALAAWAYLPHKIAVDPVYSGTVEAVEVLPSFQMPGRIVSVNFAEGEAVFAGQLLAVLDSAELADQAARAFANLEAIRSRLDPLNAQAAYLEKAVEARIALARANLDKVTAGLRPQEVESARQAAAEARARADQARDEAQRAERLVSAGTIPAVRRDESRRAAEAAQAALRRAEENLALAEAGARSEDVLSARAALAAAEAERTEVRRARLEVAAAGKQVALAEADLRLSQTRLSYAAVRSPMAGVVLTRNVEPGETAMPGSPIASIADLSTVEVRIYLEQGGLGKVRLGQEAVVAADAYPDRTFAGRVAYLSDQAEFTPKSVQTREERTKLVYMCKVRVTNPDLALKPGMPVDVTLGQAP